MSSPTETSDSISDSLPEPSSHHTMITYLKEVDILAIHNQILYNLRILKPEIENPTITSGFKEHGTTLQTINGTWSAAVWDDRNRVVFRHRGGVDVVAAMRGLLRMTSAGIVAMEEEWEGLNKQFARTTINGTEYISFCKSALNKSNLGDSLTDPV